MKPSPATICTPARAGRFPVSASVFVSAAQAIRGSSFLSEIAVIGKYSASVSNGLLRRTGSVSELRYVCGNRSTWQLYHVMIVLNRIPNPSTHDESISAHVRASWQRETATPEQKNLHATMNKAVPATMNKAVHATMNKPLLPTIEVPNSKCRAAAALCGQRFEGVYFSLRLAML